GAGAQSVSGKEQPAGLNIEQMDHATPNTQDKAIAGRAKGEMCAPVIEPRVENARLWLQLPARHVEGVKMDHAAAACVGHGQGGAVRAPNAITGSTPGKFRCRPQGARLKVAYLEQALAPRANCHDRLRGMRGKAEVSGDAIRWKMALASTRVGRIDAEI